jgi:hypothetical protein
MRLRERGSSVIQTGTLLRLAADTVVFWADLPGAMPPLRRVPLSAVERIEVAERVPQMSAFRRGAARGAGIGALLGLGLIAIDRDLIGGAAGLTIGGAWLGGVFAGQQTDSPRPPMRWRIVYPSSNSRGAQDATER